MKQWLKQRVAERWRWRIRKLDRLRWIAKARNIRRDGLSIKRNIRYVLFDPELESYTYRVANVEGMLETISEVTGVPVEALRIYVAEVDADPELGDRLARRLRWRFDVKHRPQLANRLGWYALIRAMRPAVAVETGIYHGLGSLALLRALERNKADGAPGELISFDTSETAGSFVDRGSHPGWRHVVGSTTETLERTLAGRRVGALFQDSDHSDEIQRLEFEAALSNPDPALLLVDGSGGQSPILEQLSRDRGGDYRCVHLGAADHWYQRGTLAFAVFRTDRDG